MLYVRHRSQIVSLFAGGGQEAGVRPGTENVAGIVGAAEAIAIGQAGYINRAEAVAAVRDVAIVYLQTVLPSALINGPVGEERLANNLNLSLPGIDTEYAVVWLDTHGVAASTKSACAGAGGGMSHVVFACTKDTARASSTIRLSLHESITEADMRHTIDILAAFCKKMGTLTP
jgi:cysteine desulfurase